MKIDVSQTKSIDNVEAKLRTIIEYSPQAILVFDLKLSHFIDANRKAEILFGYDRKEFLSLDPAILSPKFQPNGEESEPLAKKKIQEALENGSTNFEWIHKNRQSEIIHCNVYLVKLPDNSHNVILGSIVDITKEVKAREKLKESEERLRLALGAAKLGTWIWDIQQGKINWSDEVYEIFDIDPSDFNGTLKEYEDLIYILDKKNVFNALQLSLDKNIPYTIEHRIHTKKNTLKWLEGKGSVERNSEGTAIRMLGTVMDITERKLAEQYLKASEERLAMFYKFTNEAILIVNADDMRIIDINRKFKELFLFDDSEIKTLEPQNLMTQESWNRIKHSFHKDINQFESEILARKKTNIIFPANLRVYYFLDRDQNKFILTITDITTTKEAEQLKKVNREILLQNEKLKIKN